MSSSCKGTVNPSLKIFDLISFHSRLSVSSNYIMMTSLQRIGGLGYVQKVLTGHALQRAPFVWPVCVLLCVGVAHSLRQGNPNKSNPFLSRFVAMPPLDSLTKMQTVEIKLNSFLLKQNPFEYRFFLSRCVCVCAVLCVCFEPKRTCQMINHFMSAFNTFPVAFALGCVSLSPCHPVTLASSTSLHLSCLFHELIFLLFSSV